MTTLRLLVNGQGNPAISRPSEGLPSARTGSGDACTGAVTAVLSRCWPAEDSTMPTSLLSTSPRYLPERAKIYQRVTRPLCPRGVRLRIEPTPA